MSKIIKSQWAQAVYDEQKVISIKVLQSLNKDEIIPELNLQAAAKHQEVMNQAYSEAEKILKDAKLQANTIREEIMRERNAWGQEKLRLMEEAQREGFFKGVEDGKMEGRKEYRDVILFAQEIVDTAKKDYESHVASAEKTILKIGMSAAGKILGTMLSGNEETFLAIVKRALKEARESSDVQLHVHPDHYEFIVSRKDELSVIFPKETDIYIYPNDELTKNGCYIESANGRIDASVDSQLEELKRKLLELLESEA